MSDTFAPSFGAQAYNPAHPRYLAYTLDFTSVGVLNGDLQRQQTRGKLEFVQSVFIDNSQNQSTLTLVFLGTGQTVVAQPLSQGYYPLNLAPGVVRFAATASQGQKIPLIFSNVPTTGFVWGPTPGALVVPALTNAPISIPAMTVGTNLLVAGLANTTIKVYRLFYTLNNGATVTLKDSAGNFWTGPMVVTPGGGAAFQASGVPWFTCAIGADLDIVSSFAAQMGGAIGYVQS